MRIDVLGAIKRMFTLPKAKNSLSDIVGPAEAAVVVGMVHDGLATAIATGLHLLITQGEKDIAKAQAFLVGELTHVMTDISPALASQVQTVVTGIVTNAEAIAEGSLTKTGDALLAAVLRLLKIA